MGVRRSLDGCEHIPVGRIDLTLLTVTYYIDEQQRLPGIIRHVRQTVNHCATDILACGVVANIVTTVLLVHCLYAVNAARVSAAMHIIQNQASAQFVCLRIGFQVSPALFLRTVGINDIVVSVRHIEIIRRLLSALIHLHQLPAPGIAISGTVARIVIITHILFSKAVVGAVVTQVALHVW